MADVKPLGVGGPQQRLGIVGARTGAMLRWTHPSNRGLKTADGLGAAGLILLSALLVTSAKSPGLCREDLTLKRSRAHRAGARSAAKSYWRTESEIDL